MCTIISHWEPCVFEVLCLVYMCVHVHKHPCWLYPKVVYVLFEVIGLLNSSNAMAETPPSTILCFLSNLAAPCFILRSHFNSPQDIHNKDPVDLQETSRSADK